MGQRHQLICQVCGKITEFHWDSFDDKKLPLDVTEWGALVKKQITLRGICNECMNASKK